MTASLPPRNSKRPATTGGARGPRDYQGLVRVGYVSRRPRTTTGAGHPMGDPSRNLPVARTCPRFMWPVMIVAPGVPVQPDCDKRSAMPDNVTLVRDGLIATVTL